MKIFVTALGVTAKIQKHTKCLTMENLLNYDLFHVIKQHAIYKINLFSKTSHERSTISYTSAVYLESCVCHLLKIMFHPFSSLLGPYTHPFCSSYYALLMETTYHTFWNKKKPLDGNPFIFYHGIHQPHPFPHSSLLLH